MSNTYDFEKRKSSKAFANSVHMETQVLSEIYNTFFLCKNNNGNNTHSLVSKEMIYVTVTKTTSLLLLVITITLILLLLPYHTIPLLLLPLL